MPTEPEARNRPAELGRSRPAEAGRERCLTHGCGSVPTALPPLAAAAPLDTAATATRGCAELGRGGRSTPGCGAPAAPAAPCARRSPRLPLSGTDTDAPTVGGSEEVVKHKPSGEGEWRVRTEGGGEALAYMAESEGEEADCGSKCTSVTLSLSAMT